MRRLRLPLVALALASLACSFLPAPTATAVPPTPLPAATLAPPATDTRESIAAPMIAPADLAQLYSRVNQGVVTIYTFADLGPPHSNSTPIGQGSGFVIDTDGHIVTNQHVVADANQIEVDFASGYRAWATLLGTDPDSDLAVIQVDVPAPELVAIPLGDSDTVQVGQFVVAIGNPFGLSGTMTVGVVSAVDRVLSSERVAPGGGSFSAGDLIQTDAAINPGNSGGPLLNLDGQIIGVNRAISTESFTVTGDAANSGVGFAVPVNIVRRVVPSLIENGSFDYPYLGITSLGDAGFNLRELESLGLPPNTVGVYVTCVVEGGPAARAGLIGAGACGGGDLEPGGDVIVAIDGRPVVGFSDLISYLVSEAQVGQQVTLTILRQADTLELTFALEPRP